MVSSSTNSAYSSSVGSGEPFFEQVVFALVVLVIPSVSDVSQLLRGTFASSTKYLRQSSLPYLAAVATQLSFTASDIFLSSTKIFQDV